MATTGQNLKADRAKRTLAQAELANKNISGAVEAFQLAHKAAPEWFAPKEALEMLGAPLNAKK